MWVNFNTRYLRVQKAVCDRIENSDRTGSGPGSFLPEPDRITSIKKLTKFDRIGRLFTGF